VRYVKGHGTENDFVVVPDPDGALDLTPRLVRAICDRHAGLGADGVLRVVRTSAHPDAAAMTDAAVWFMDYRNADGSVVEMCGNGIRLFARYLIDSGMAAPGALCIATRGGTMPIQVAGAGDVTVDMGPWAMPADLADLRVRVDDGPAAGREQAAVGVLMPNPHAVAFVTDLAEAGRLLEPPDVRPHGAFPRGVNVEYVVARGPRHVALRVHERGVGETRSCGTGAAAVMVVAARRAGEAGPSTYVVEVPGGRLKVSERADGHVEMTGPAVLVAEGELRADWVEENR
jgi:diaminopimelate epimerase